MRTFLLRAGFITAMFFVLATGMSQTLTFEGWVDKYVGDTPVSAINKTSIWKVLQNDQAALIRTAAANTCENNPFIPFSQSVRLIQIKGEVSEIACNDLRINVGRSLVVERNVMRDAEIRNKIENAISATLKKDPHALVIVDVGVIHAFSFFLYQLANPSVSAEFKISYAAPLLDEKTLAMSHDYLKILGYAPDDVREFFKNRDPAFANESLKSLSFLASDRSGQSEALLLAMLFLHYRLHPSEQDFAKVNSTVLLGKNETPEKPQAIISLDHHHYSVEQIYKDLPSVHELQIAGYTSLAFVLEGVDDGIQPNLDVLNGIAYHDIQDRNRAQFKQMRADFKIDKKKIPEWLNMLSEVKNIVRSDKIDVIKRRLSSDLKNTPEFPITLYGIDSPY